jgi:hypothetical protein
MSSQPPSGGLRLVSSKRRRSLSAEMFRPTEQQSSLFDDESPWMIVFACVPDLPEGVFGDLLRLSEPSFVFDLRLAPRFDIGTLNRARAFELFERFHSTYVDTTTPLMTGVKREDVIEKLIKQLSTAGKETRRPIVFLHGRSESSLATPSEILSILGQSARRLEVINVPEGG